MKKIFIALLITLTVYSFVSCDKTTTDSQTITTDGIIETTTESILETTTETTTEAIEYLEYSINNDLTTESGFNNFDANFLDVEYFPLTGKLHFHLEIEDDDYRDSYYYVITRTINSVSFDDLSMFEIYSSSVTRYHEIEYTPGKEVIVAKSPDKIYGDTIFLEPVANIIVTDPMENSRSKLESYNIIDNTIDLIDSTQTPFIDCSITFEDPDRIVETVKVLVYYPNYDIILGEKEFEVHTEMFDGDIATIEHIIFDSLCPDTTFTVLYYFSGNDGVENFTEVKMMDKKMSTPRYETGSYDPELYPGFWAHIHGITIGETTTRVDMEYINPGVLLYGDETLTASLNVYNDNNQLVATYPLTDRTEYLDIENQYLDNKYILKIESDISDTVLSITHIDFNLESLISATYSSQILRVSYQESIAQIISIHITITEVGQSTPTIDYTIDASRLSYGYTNISYPDGPDYHISDYDFVAVITYIGFNGEETTTVGYSKR